MNFTATESSNFTFVLPFNKTGLVSYASIIITLCVFGIVANTITIATILKSTTLKATWYQLITSLAVSNLVSAVISPSFLYNYSWGFETYKWPGFICKITWCLDIWTSFVTTLHILWFAFLRLFSLQWPFQFKTFVKKYGKTSIILIWIIGFLSGFVPFIIIFGVDYRDRSLPIIISLWAHCGVKPSRMLWFLWYTRIAYPILYYIPFVSILCCSVGIVIKVLMIRRKRNAFNDGEMSETEMKRRQKEKQIVLQMALIVGSFLFGYIPTTAFHFFILDSTFTTDQSYWDLTWRFAISVHILIRISECLDPIFYNLSSSAMRQETVTMLKAFWKKIKCKTNNHVGQSKGSQNTNETTF